MQGIIIGHLLSKAMRKNNKKVTFNTLVHIASGVVSPKIEKKNLKNSTGTEKL